MELILNLPEPGLWNECKAEGKYMKVYCLLPVRSAFISEELPRLPHLSGMKQLLISSSRHGLSLSVAVDVSGGCAAPRVPAVTPECPGEQSPAPDTPTWTGALGMILHAAPADLLSPGKYQMKLQNVLETL